MTTMTERLKKTHKTTHMSTPMLKNKKIKNFEIGLCGVYCRAGGGGVIEKRYVSNIAKYRYLRF